MSWVYPVAAGWKEDERVVREGVKKTGWVVDGSGEGEAEADG